MSDEDELLRRMLSTARSAARTICVCVIVLSVLSALGAGLLKSSVAAGVAFVLGAVGLGRLMLERLAVWSVVLLIIHWTGLLPLKEWIQAMIAIINRGLS
ncbi:hypothetical protein [Bradyrhizobium sp. HKCCYLS3013]|uniref:hypothetical protein n=1 Tax=Bradyrhizobium sp. HKCCYLS3013 TaxID=3420735 RepID=UPI003EBE73AA